jgi:hypothetical protein
MCLTVVKETRNGKGTAVRIGWKVFSTFRDVGIQFEHQYTDQKPILGKWMKAIEKRVRVWDNTLENKKCYQSGFHIYETQQGARRGGRLGRFAQIWKVKYRGVLARGIQDQSDVVVARYMYIPK